MHVKYILDAQNVESVGKNCKMGVDGLTQVVNLETSSCRWRKYLLCLF